MRFPVGFYGIHGRCITDDLDNSSFGGVVGKSLIGKVVRERGRRRIGDSECKQLEFLCLKGEQRNAVTTGQRNRVKS